MNKLTKAVSEIDDYKGLLVIPTGGDMYFDLRAQRVSLFSFSIIASTIFTAFFIIFLPLGYLVIIIG